MTTTTLYLRYLSCLRSGDYAGAREAFCAWGHAVKAAGAATEGEGER